MILLEESLKVAAASIATAKAKRDKVQGFLRVRPCLPGTVICRRDWLIRCDVVIICFPSFSAFGFAVRARLSTDLFCFCSLFRHLGKHIKGYLLTVYLSRFAIFFLFLVCFSMTRMRSR